MARALVTRAAWLCGVLTLSIGVAPAAAQPSALTLDDRRVEVLSPRAGLGATVLIFTATDCPISNRYAPEVKRLHERFAASGVRFVLVYANPHDRPDAIREHVAKFAYPPAMDVVRDPAHELVAFAHATTSPEAVVFDAIGHAVYRGRIDDRFASVGVDRQTATRRDLFDALTAIVEGRPVATPVTPAVGCVLADFRP